MEEMMFSNFIYWRNDVLKFCLVEKYTLIYGRWSFDREEVLSRACLILIVQNWMKWIMFCCENKLEQSFSINN